MAEGVEFDQPTLRLVVRALRDEADGKELRRDLARNLRAAAQPALVAVRASILTMPSKGRGKPPSLRASIAAATRIHVRLGAKPGVSIASHNRGIPRGFRNAARKLNSTKPWRHPFFGSWDPPVVQTSRKPGWFVQPLVAARGEFVDAAGEALDNVAQRISRKTRG